MRHLLALAFACAALGLTAAGTQALRANEAGPALPWFILAPVRVFDGITCG